MCPRTLPILVIGWGVVHVHNTSFPSCDRWWNYFDHPMGELNYGLRYPPPPLSPAPFALLPAEWQIIHLLINTMKKEKKEKKRKKERKKRKKEKKERKKEREKEEKVHVTRTTNPPISSQTCKPLHHGILSHLIHIFRQINIGWNI